MELKKNREDEIFITNALETESRFRATYSFTALLLFLQDKDFKGKTARGDAFWDCDKYRQAPLSNMGLNIFMKKSAEKLSIALITILMHQEV
jgi:hypothetical protein